MSVHPRKVAHATQKSDQIYYLIAERFDPYSRTMSENWYVQCASLLRMTNAVLRRTRTEIVENYDELRTTNDSVAVVLEAK